MRQRPGLNYKNDRELGTLELLHDEHGNDLGLPANLSQQIAKKDVFARARAEIVCDDLHGITFSG